MHEHDRHVIGPIGWIRSYADDATCRILLDLKGSHHGEFCGDQRRLSTALIPASSGRHPVPESNNMYDTSCPPSLVASAFVWMVMLPGSFAKPQQFVIAL